MTLRCIVPTSLAAVFGILCIDAPTLVWHPPFLSDWARCSRSHERLSCSQPNAGLSGARCFGVSAWIMFWSAAGGICDKYDYDESFTHLAVGANLSTSKCTPVH